uniref:Uncharacterized protein n=1 Tax=Sphaerodactylus townsendi TaxID=933632 RepID=A0ACB8EC91_9SAUR
MWPLNSGGIPSTLIVGSWINQLLPPVSVAGQSGSVPILFHLNFHLSCCSQTLLPMAHPILSCYTRNSTNLYGKYRRDLGDPKNIVNETMSLLDAQPTYRWWPQIPHYYN